MVRGVIFDMDGVLVDSERFYHTQRLEFLRRMDYVPENTTHLVGSNEPVIWETLVPEDEQLQRELLSGYHGFRRLHPIPYMDLLNPQAVELLTELRRRGLKTGIASSSVRESVDRMLAITKLGHLIDCAVSGEECTAYKPNPEVYQRALEVLNLTPDEAIAVEDSPTGIAAAINAGMCVYGLRPNYGVYLDQRGATAVLEHLNDLLLFL